MDSFRLIRVTREQGVICIRLQCARLEEMEIQELGDEILIACGKGACRLALALGPETPSCLYSVFLAKLVAIRNTLYRQGGRMVLCEVAPNSYDAFQACQLHREFVFLPDFKAALTHFSAAASDPSANDAQ